jgi:ketosteroid isomerase-like protein
MRLSGRPIRGTLITIAVLVTATVAAFATQPAFAIHPLPLHEKKHDAKRQVEALEGEWRAAQLAGDVGVMDKLLSDDYIGISMTGQVNTKAQTLDRARSHKLVLSQLDLGEMQVKMVGAIAIVTSLAQVEGTNDGQPVKGTFRYTRVYQHLPSGEWKITSFEATRVPSRDVIHGNHDADTKGVKDPKDIKDPKEAKVPPAE